MTIAIVFIIGHKKFEDCIKIICPGDKNEYNTFELPAGAWCIKIIDIAENNLANLNRDLSALGSPYLESSINCLDLKILKTAYVSIQTMDKLQLEQASNYEWCKWQSLLLEKMSNNPNLRWIKTPQKNWLLVNLNLSHEIIFRSDIDKYLLNSLMH